MSLIRGQDQKEKRVKEAPAENVVLLTETPFIIKLPNGTARDRALWRCAWRAPRRGGAAEARRGRRVRDTARSAARARRGAVCARNTMHGAPRAEVLK